MDNIIKFYISGPVIPKARPKVTRYATFMPRNYQNWRNHAETEFLEQVEKYGLKPFLPVQRAGIDVQLIGKHHMNGDADNILGSYLDALVAVGILRNDNLNCVPKISLEHITEGVVGAYITITPMAQVVAIKKARTKPKTKELLSI